MMTVLPATDTRSWWQCEKCRAKLGEIVNGSVIMRFNGPRGTRTIIAPLPVRQQCGSCGTWNEQRKEAA